MEGVAACYARCAKTYVIWLIGRLLFFPPTPEIKKINFFFSNMFFSSE